MSNSDLCDSRSYFFSQTALRISILLLSAFSFSFSYASNGPVSGEPVGKISFDYSYEARTSDSRVMQFREWVSGYAQNFTGIRYKYAGRSPQTGFDCSGFTSFCMKEFDISVSASSSTQSQQGERISLDEVLPGDLVFFGKGSHIQHVAMVVECSAEGIICVHSTCTRGVIVENINTSKYWAPKILFARDVITSQVRDSKEFPSDPQPVQVNPEPKPESIPQKKVEPEPIEVVFEHQAQYCD